MDFTYLLQPHDTFPTLYSSETVSSLLGKSTGTHDGVLVHDDSNTYKGMAYAYKMLYKRRPTHDAKVSSILFTPQKITLKTSLAEILQTMINSRLYTLPVFDDSDNLIGILTAKKLLQSILEDPKQATPLLQRLSFREPLVVQETAKIKDMYALMRKEQLSRVVVVSNEGTLEGVLTRRDIYLALLSPAPNDRHRGQGGKMPSAFFDRDWVTHLDYPVKTYMSRPALYSLESDSRESIVTKLLKSNKNSIVITNRLLKPVGIITTRSVLTTLLQLQPLDTIQAIVTDKNTILSAFRKIDVEEMLNTFAIKLGTRMKISRIEVVVEPIKQSNRSINQYQLKMIVTNPTNSQLISSCIHHRLRDAMRDCENKILRQLDR